MVISMSVILIECIVPMFIFNCITIDHDHYRLAET